MNKRQRKKRDKLLDIKALNEAFKDLVDYVPESQEPTDEDLKPKLQYHFLE